VKQEERRSGDDAVGIEWKLSKVITGPCLEDRTD
jgi:hypothetical protein